MSEQEVQARPGRIPHDVDAEKSVLSTVFYDASYYDTVAVLLQPDDFFSSANREVFEAMSELSAAGTVISRASVSNFLRKEGRLQAVGGMSYITDLVDYEGSSAALKYTVETVKKAALKRKLLEAAQAIVQDSMTPQSDVEVLLEEAERRISELIQDRPQDAAVVLEEIITQVYKDVRSRIESGETLLGVNTGFDDLDEMTSGFHKGNLIILAARPSMGKTALALNIAANAAQKYGKWVVFFSLEMSREELGFRLLSTESGINGKRLRKGEITKREMTDFLAGVKKLSNTPIVVDDTAAITVSDFRNRARKLKKEGKCDFIMVDYLQLMRGISARSSNSREQEISEISRTLKAIAKELEVPVLALSQLNRSVETRGKDKRPQLSDLRESGAIEQDADVIIFIYRDDYYNKESEQKGQAELIIGKQRNGATGTVHVAFQPDFARFVNLRMQADDLGPLP
jgi:replicative DNA helicase